MSTQDHHDFKNHAIVIGCGYLGVRVARVLQARGHKVDGTSRRQARFEEFERQGIRGLQVDFATGNDGALFEHPYGPAIYAVAPGADGDDTLVFRDTVLRLIDRWHAAPPARFLLISSTGVYSQNSGEWVDETSTCDPESERYRRILEGETAVLSAARQGFPGMVLRLGGIYGPNRSPVDWVRDDAWRRRLEGGAANAFMNWIHVDDAAAAIALAAERGAAGAIYLIVDDEPVRRCHFYAEACRLAGVPGLSLTDDPRRLSKRCSNRRTREELGFQPQFANYREGLAALASQDSSPVDRH